jgi:hypothetical protein
MPRKAPEMTALEVRRLNKPGLFFVGEVPGLAIQVLPRAAGDDREPAKTWILRASIGGKRRDMGLGGFPELKLKDARDAARDARDKIRRGIDPIEERRAARSALAANTALGLSFKEAAESYISAHEPSWKNPKHRQQWKNTLKTYAYPNIGSLAVRDVQLPHVLQILEPIWTTKT